MSTHTHALTQAPEQTTFCTQSTTLTQVKQITRRGLNDGGETTAREGKRGGSIVLEKKISFNVGFEMKQSREGFCRRGGGRSFHVRYDTSEERNTKASNMRA